MSSLSWPSIYIPFTFLPYFQFSFASQCFAVNNEMFAFLTLSRAKMHWIALLAIMLHTSSALINPDLALSVSLSYISHVTSSCSRTVGLL
jgi:hypothetical protein